MQINTKKLVLLVNIFLLQINLSLAQQTVACIASSTAPANASVAYSENRTAFHNPAILALSENKSVTLAYHNRFQLKELSTTTLSANLPNSILNFGIDLAHYGYSEYNETQVGISAAKTFSKRFNIGLQLNYYNAYLSPEAGNKGAIVVQIGILSEIFSRFYVGFHAYNPVQTNIEVKATEKRLPSLMSLGCQYTFDEHFLWVAQLDKEVDYDLLWRTGFEYIPIKQLAIRIGGYGNPFVPSLGAGLKLQHFALDLSFEQHPSLGINSICSLAYEF